jgi:[acyl-carrier-protein] S-malonyltransferase
MWATLFPGQGSQHPGMGKFLFEEFQVVREAFEEASDSVSVDFKKLCFDGSEEQLALTENTQPCLVLVSSATDRVLRRELGFDPKVAAGHSVGEYSAMVSAQVMELKHAIQAVRIRGQAMQSAVPVGLGGMTAVMGLDGAQTLSMCQWAMGETKEGPVEPANLNAPGQIVISGKKTVLDWLATNFKPEAIGASGRVKFIPLKVSAPFHCSMMKPAEEKMAQVLGDIPFRTAKTPVVQNVTATPETDGEKLRQSLIKQVCAPVRWIESIQKISQLGHTKAVESGCGRVLAGLVKKIEPNLACLNLNSMDDLRALEVTIKGG